jgi:hypothetical protein
MKSNNRSKLLSLVLIPTCGLLVLALCYLGYFAVYMFIESVFFTNNPTSVPAGIIRSSYAIVLIAVYLLLLRTKLSDLIKTIILIGPMTMLIITVILTLYLTPVFAALSTILITAFCIFLMYKYRKPWIYYYASAISVVAAIAYAWPRS